MAITVPEDDDFAAYTDGACSGNPGPGGFAYLIQFANPEPGWDGRKMGWGSEPKTTNNRMELQAVTACLQHLGPEDRGVVHSDSQYVVKGVNDWRAGWEKKGKLREGADTPNLDLWLRLYEIRDQRPNVRLTWVKGHADNEANNEVDRLAVEAAAKQLPATRAKSRPAVAAPPRNAVFEAVIAAEEKKLARLKALGPLGQEMVEQTAEMLGPYHVAAYLFSHIPALGKAPIEFLEAGKADAVEALRLHLERINAGVYS